MKLIKASDEQKKQRDAFTFAEWGQALPSVAAFQERENRLRAHPYCRESMTTWFLVDQSNEVLSSCETFRMSSFLKNAAGVLVSGSTYGFASVYTEPRFRGFGYASKMMSLVVDQISTNDLDVHSFILYSEVGAPIYERLGFTLCPSFDRVFPPMAESNNSAVPASAARLLTHATFAEEWNGFKPWGDPRFIVWPSAAQLDWHFERERIYASLLNRSLPEFCGAVNEGGLMLWAIDFKSASLRGLVLVGHDADSLSIESVDSLLAVAQGVAANFGLKEVRIWESDGFSNWNALTQKSERVHRGDGLAMVLPANNGLKPTDWNFIPRSLWV